MSHPNNIRSSALYTMLELYRLREENRAGKAVSWNRLLEISRPLLVTDGRDKAFATIGWMTRLNPTSERSKAQILDYSLLIPDIYLNTADSLNFNPHDGLFLSSLSMKEDHDSQQESMPSWVPDWRMPHQIYRLNSDENCFSASGSQSSVHSYRGKKLVVRGCAVDTIAGVGQYLSPRQPHDKFRTGAANVAIFAKWYKWAVTRAETRHHPNSEWYSICVPYPPLCLPPISTPLTVNSIFCLNKARYCFCTGLKPSKQSEDMSLPT